MFGYIICNKNGLTEEEKERYQKIYCGLCQILKKKYGQLERLSLNFDMTFLILFLSSLYEPEEKEEEFRCAVHPVHKKRMTVNAFTEYAADMTIVLSYFKCLDNWQDDRSYISKKYADVLERAYQKIKKQYPRQCECIASSIRELSRIEKDASAMPDDAVNCSGRMLSEIFVCQEDFWSDSLRRFGFELGKFIYLMDAAVDYKKDVKKESYNPLLQMGKQPIEAEELLRCTIGNAAGQFEKLPLVQDAHLLKNILYGGVWQIYHARVIGKEKNHGE